jgi:cell division protein ZapD
MIHETRSLILYEYPFGERVRTLLRIEDLFHRLDYFVGQPHPYCHHAALATLFEILEITSRADLKGDLLLELERQRQALLTFRNNPNISESALDSILQEIEQAHGALNSTPGKAGQQLRDNEWLTSLRGRVGIPGGTSEFDIPSYHAWLMGSLEVRARDLENWTRPLQQFDAALSIVLRLLRDTAQSSQQVATQGSFQQSLQGRIYALMQVRVAPDLAVIPEISANKYMVWIRFTAGDRDLKPRSVDRNVPFELSLCAL